MCTQFDDLHYHRKFFLSELPPTSESMRLHILRAFYITHIQINIIKDTQGLNPTNFRYEKDSDNLVPEKSKNISS